MDMQPNKLVQPIPGPYQTNAPMSIASDFGGIHGTGGLKLMRRDSAVEYGVSASLFPIHFRGGRSVDTVSSAGPGFEVDQPTFVARQAIPIKAFFNYCHHRSKAYAFIGLSAGIVIARGRDMQDVNTLKYYQSYTT